MYHQCLFSDIYFQLKLQWNSIGAISFVTIGVRYALNPPSFYDMNLMSHLE